MLFSFQSTKQMSVGSPQDLFIACPHPDRLNWPSLLVSNGRSNAWWCVCSSNQIKSNQMTSTPIHSLNGWKVSAWCNLKWSTLHINITMDISIPPRITQASTCMYQVQMYKRMDGMQREQGLHYAHWTFSTHLPISLHVCLLVLNAYPFSIFLLGLRKWTDLLWFSTHKPLIEN